MAVVSASCWSFVVQRDALAFAATIFIGLGSCIAINGQLDFA
jgi:hypothetical protein